MNESEKIVEGIMNVKLDKFSQIIQDPNGDYPRCKPRLGLNPFRTTPEQRASYVSVCENCGMDMELNEGKACPASNPEGRWRIKFKGDD